MREPPVPSSWLRLRHFATRYSSYIWIVALTIFAGLFLFQGRQDLARAVDTLRDSSPLWIAVIAAVQIAALVITARTYQWILRHTGNRVSLHHLVSIHLERKVVGTVVPAGGPASVYVFVRGAGRRGVSSQDALFTVGVRSLLGYASFVFLLLPAMLLARPEGLLLAGSLALVAVFVLTAVTAIVLMRSQRALDGFARRMPVRIADLLHHIRAHRTRPADLTRPFLLALLGQFANIATLVASIYALGYSPSVSSIIAAYTVGTVAVTLAPAFQGIGVVEVTMAITLQQFGIPPGVAIGATLLYRGATVWFPLFLGAISHAGQRITLPGLNPVWTGMQLRPSLPDGLVRRAIATPLVLAVMMVTLSGSDSSYPTNRVVDAPRYESSIHLTAR